MIYPCPDCEKSTETIEVTESQEVIMKGIDIEFQATFYKCVECGCTYDTMDTLGLNLESARSEFDRMQNDRS